MKAWSDVFCRHYLTVTARLRGINYMIAISAGMKMANVIYSQSAIRIRKFVARQFVATLTLPRTNSPR